MSLQSFIAVAGALLAIVGTAATSYAYARKGKSESIIALYKEENAALQLRVQRLTDEGRVRDIEIEKLKTEIEALKVAAKVLTDTVRGTSAIGVLSEKVDAYHHETLSLFRSFGREWSERELNKPIDDERRP